MNFKDEFKPAWIVGMLDNAAVDFAQRFGEHLCDLQNGRLGRMALTTNQIRNFFGEVKRIQAKTYEKEKSAFLLIRPKLAYAEARALQKSGKSRITDFRQVMERAHAAVNNEQQFQNFVDFLEAVLAFHKFYGGRD